MKYFVILLCVYLFSCSSGPVAPYAVDKDIPQPPQVQNLNSQRSLASNEEYSDSSYQKFFGEYNYVERLHRVRRLANLTQSIMEDKGHPRKRLLKKFQEDLDKQIALLEKVETDKDNTAASWLPKLNSYQYGAKVRAVQAVKNSADVMNQLDSYLSSTKVMEDSSSDQNFYLGLLRKAVKAMGDELQQRDGVKASVLLPTQLSYGHYLSSVARAHLHKVFSDKKSRQLKEEVNGAFKKIQAVRNAPEAKAIVKSREIMNAYFALQMADYSNSSDIEGSRDDMDTKMATYFSLGMIKYLYGQLN